MISRREAKGTGGAGARLRRPGRTGVGALLAVLMVWAAPVRAQEAGEIQEACASCHEGVEPERERRLSHPDSLTCLSCHHLGFTNDPDEARAARLEACSTCHVEIGPTHVEGTDGATECTSCHRLHDDPPLSDAPLPGTRCVSCHESPHGLHGELPAQDAPACAACHTLHDGDAIREGDPRLARECVSCHADVHPSHPLRAGSVPSCTTCHGLEGDASPPEPEPLLSATCRSCHGELRRAHTSVGTGAPGCADCHSYRDDPPLPEARPLLVERCGSCHPEAMDAFRSGAHAGGLEPGTPDVPDCLTCHPAHDGAAEAGRSVRLAATIRCLECHSDSRLSREYGLLPTVGTSYLEDFHGTTLRFLSSGAGDADQPEVMTCSDCHGAHAVVTTDEARVAEVCLRCHQEGDVNLAGAWLGHTPPGPRNNAVVWLVRLAYFVLIPFILVGLAVHIAFHLRDQRRKGARMLEAPRMRRILAWLAGRPRPEPATVRRFTVLERLEHLGSMVTFFVLVVTGLPQIDPGLPAAHRVIAIFGGIGATRLVHRVAGFAFVALLLLHLGRAVYRALRRRRLPIMVPTRKDFEDTLATLRHYLSGAPRPRVGKFDFSQKFEYWGLLLGGLVISVTGVVLVYPELVSLLVPGEVVATSRVIHGLEATLAVLTVVLWHSWGVILRPEIFPLDTTIFTGEMEVERLKEEHPLEYERLLGEGRIEEEDADEVAGSDGEETGDGDAPPGSPGEARPELASTTG